MTAEKATRTTTNNLQCTVESHHVESAFLDRSVKVDVYVPGKFQPAAECAVLFVNDGQDLPKMPFTNIFNTLLEKEALKPLLIVAMHCSPERKLEYGTADVLDFLSRGSRAKYHRKFLLRELIPYIMQLYRLERVTEMAYAGFSLGGLSAFDVAWKFPEVFTKVGAFSGSFWWRLKDLDDGYVEETDRIMHNLVREGKYTPGLKFFFQTGTLDETMDRNNNGIIDSIDDTLTLIDELVAKGYNKTNDITYYEMPDGRHDVPTWAKAFPAFLEWGWARPTANK